jgi:hypothetical protein
MQLAFESLDLLAQSGLHDVFARCSATEVQFLGQRHEIPKLAQLHGKATPLTVESPPTPGRNPAGACRHTPTISSGNTTDLSN